MTQAAWKVVVVDRPAWYEPVLERQELRRAGADVVVGWATVADRPAEADRGYPTGQLTREALSRITGACVPPAMNTQDRVIEMGREAHGLLVVRADISAEVMDRLPKLRVIGRYGIGVDNLDVAAATQRGIAVVNTPGFCVREVADHTMALVLACSRKVGPLDKLLRQGEWGRDTAAAPMPAVFTQTLGLIGFGEIAREVSRRAQVFGLTILAHDPYVNAAEMAACGVKAVGLDDLLAASDFVSIHAPLTAATKHLVGEKQLRRMKPTAYVINTSRGALVDEAALVTALERGWIAGAGLDVFEREPLGPSSLLLGRADVLLTPHVAGVSDESQEACRVRVARAMADILLGGWPSGRELRNPEVRDVPPRHT